VENPPSSNFCGKCGAPLIDSAVSGGATPSTDSASNTRVTPEQPDAATAIDGERKTVTALFADIKGSMELMEDLDPEEARAIIDPVLHLMIEAVRRYDGYIVQSTGDGIFALFGAPVAHEDHPQRALYAALRMQEEMRRYSARLRESGNLPIEARVGVNTGEVVVRSIRTGEAHTEYAPIGHSTGLAARMQTLAPTGSIAMTDATRRQCEGYFTFRALGLARIKGVSDAVNVYEVTGLGPLRTRLQAAARLGLTKFVGRQGELEQMKHVLELTRNGHGQIVAALGEAGVGKSRLFFEFKAIAGGGRCGARSLFGLARQGLGLLAGDRTAAQLFRHFRRGQRTQTARKGRRQNRDPRSGVGGHAALHL
jgi:class 3 adenylate cyclase